MTDRVTISRKGLNDLISDYRTALGKVNDAGAALEDASVFIGGAGAEFTRQSVRVIDQTNALYVAINATIGRLREVTPDE